jgi:hypothetical protein
MGMCAIYTAVAPPSPEELAALAKQNEASTYGPRRRTVGRRAVAELALLFAPPSHLLFLDAILEKDLWGFLTPAATRGNHIAALARANPEVAVPSPLWPATIEFACLVGTEPARYVGNNLVMLPPDVVAAGNSAFALRAAASEPAQYLGEFFQHAAARGQAMLLHWDYR